MSTRFRALKHRNFQLFLGGQLVSLAGTWMQTAAQLWLIYRLTHSPALLGIFGFANQIPILLLAPLGGYAGDRYSRHRGVIWTQTTLMVLAFLLAALTLTGVIRVWEIIFIGFLVGIVNAFDIPIRQAFLVQMVGKEDLPNAIALNSSVFNGARTVGPAVAGFAILWVGEGWCFFMNGVSFLAVIAALLAMRIERIESRAQGGSALRNLAEGYRFVRNDVPVRSALLLLSLLSLLGLQYSVFLPVFAKDVLQSDARMMGYLMSAASVGAALGTLHFAARTKYTGLARWIAVTSATWAVALMVFSQARFFWLSATALFLFGFAATVQMTATNTVTQQRVPDALRSRVMAVYAMMLMGFQPVGALLASGVVKRAGAPAMLAVFGAVCFIGALVFALKVLLPIEQRRAAERRAESRR